MNEGLKIGWKTGAAPCTFISHERLIKFGRWMRAPENGTIDAFWRIRTNHAIEDFNNGRINISLMDFRAIAENRPKCKEAHYNLACLHMATGDYELAFGYVDRSLSLDSYDANHYRLRGLAYHTNLDQKKAINDYFMEFRLVNRSRNANIRLSETLVRIGDSYATIGDYQNAHEAYQKALEFDGKNADAIIGRAAIWNLGGHTDSAINEIMYALGLEPKDAGAWHLLGMIYWKNGNLDVAYGYMMNAIEADPLFENANNAVMRLAEIMGLDVSTIMRRMEMAEKFPKMENEGMLH